MSWTLHEGERGGLGADDQPPSAVLFDSAAALDGAEGLCRFMARTLQFVTGFVGSGGAVFYPVDAEGEGLRCGPIVYELRPPELFAPHSGLRAYRAAALQGGDALAPKRFAHDPATSVASDSGGLPGLEVGPRAAMYLRDDRRIVATVVLLRRPREEGPSATQLEFLRRSQPLIQEGYLIARQASGPREVGLLGESGLTERQLEVARLVAQGLSNERIAERLVVSEATVKSHLHRVFAKLGVHSRTQLLLMLGSMLDGEDRNGHSHAWSAAGGSARYIARG